MMIDERRGEERRGKERRGEENRGGEGRGEEIFFVIKFLSACTFVHLS